MSFIFDFDDTFKTKVQTIYEYCGEGELYLCGKGDAVTLIGRGKSSVKNSSIKTEYQLLQMGLGLDFSIIADLKKLHMFLKQYADGNIEVKGSTIKIGKGKNTVKMLVEPEKEIDFPELDATTQTELNNKLMSCLDVAKYAINAGDPGSRPATAFVHIESKDDICSIKALDGSCACLAEFKVESQEEFRIAIPGDVLEKLLKIKAEKASIGCAQRKGIAQIGDYTIAFLTLEEGLGIDLKSITGQMPKLSVRVKKADLCAFVNKVVVFQDSNYRTFNCDYIHEGNILKLQFSSQVGSTLAEVPIQQAAGLKEDMLLCYSYLKINDCLKNLKGDIVQMDWVSPLSPTVIREVADDVTFTHIVMPVRRKDLEQKETAAA